MKLYNKKDFANPCICSNISYRTISVFLSSMGLTHRPGKGQISHIEINKHGHAVNLTHNYPHQRKCCSWSDDGREVKRKGTDLRLKVRRDVFETVAMCLAGFRRVDVTVNESVMMTGRFSTVGCRRVAHRRRNGRTFNQMESFQNSCPICPSGKEPTGTIRKGEAKLPRWSRKSSVKFKWTNRVRYC